VRVMGSILLSWMGVSSVVSGRGGRHPIWTSLIGIGCCGMTGARVSVTSGIEMRGGAASGGGGGGATVATGAAGAGRYGCGSACCRGATEARAGGCAPVPLFDSADPVAGCDRGLVAECDVSDLAGAVEVAGSDSADASLDCCVVGGVMV